MGRKTEYKRQFREPTKLMQEEYKRNVQYCHLRRQLEHQHNFIEWDWDSESDNGQQYESRNKNVSNSRYQRMDQDESEEESPRCEKQVQTPDWHNNGKQTTEISREPAVDKMDKTDLITPKTKPSSGKKRRSTSGQKRKSRPSTSPRNDAKTPKTDPKPPFHAFGWADATKGIGAKKTYNVRATNEVHPAALRAYKRRELDILKTEEDRRRETLRKKRVRALFNASPPRTDDDVWLTEYQRNFSARTPSR